MSWQGIVAIIIVICGIVAGGILGWRSRRKVYHYPDGGTGTTPYDDGDEKK